MLVIKARQKFNLGHRVLAPGEALDFNNPQDVEFIRQRLRWSSFAVAFAAANGVEQPPPALPAKPKPAEPEPAEPEKPADEVPAPAPADEAPAAPADKTPVPTAPADPPPAPRPPKRR
jgi:hypothetical protein